MTAGFPNDGSNFHLLSHPILSFPSPSPTLLPLPPPFLLHVSPLIPARGMGSAAEHGRQTHTTHTVPYTYVYSSEKRTDKIYTKINVRTETDGIKTGQKHKSYYTRTVDAPYRVKTYSDKRPKRTYHIPEILVQIYYTLKKW